MAAGSRDIQLTELKDMISELNMTIKTLNNTIARQQSENDNLKAELAWFRQKLFGTSSERRTDDVAGQLSLFESLPEEEKPVELIEPEIVELPRKPRKRNQLLRSSLKVYLPDRSLQIRYLMKKKYVLCVAAKC